MTVLMLQIRVSTHRMRPNEEGRREGDARQEACDIIAAWTSAVTSESFVLYVTAVMKGVWLYTPVGKLL